MYCVVGPLTKSCQLIARLVVCTFVNTGFVGAAGVASAGAARNPDAMIAPRIDSLLVIQLAYKSGSSNKQVFLLKKY